MGILAHLRNKKRSFYDQLFSISDSERNEIICRLYNIHGWSAVELSHLTELSRQRIHQIVKEGK